MENHIAVVSHANNKITKYKDFSSQSDANAHVSAHGGFVAAKPDGGMDYWIVDADKKTLTFDKSTSDAAEERKAILLKIYTLEAEITPRRTREAILGTDSDWLKNKEAEIATERGKL